MTAYLLSYYFAFWFSYSTRDLGSLGSFQRANSLSHGRKVEMTSSKKKYNLNPRFSWNDPKDPKDPNIFWFNSMTAYLLSYYCSFWVSYSTRDLGQTTQCWSVTNVTNPALFLTNFLFSLFPLGLCYIRGRICHICHSPFSLSI